MIEVGAEALIEVLDGVTEKSGSEVVAVVLKDLSGLVFKFQ